MGRNTSAPLTLTVSALLQTSGRRLGLRVVEEGTSLDRRVTVGELNRPGLALAGFLEHFRSERIQILGRGEHAYCAKARPKDLAASLDAMLGYPGIPCLIMTHGAKPPVTVRLACRTSGTPLLVSRLPTAQLAGELGEILEDALAPRRSVHGVLVDVYGLGVLIMGEAGSGKSECAVELLKRGHILVADDVVDLRRLRGGILRGYCPEPLKHYMELRGLGILDIKFLFGVGAVLDSTRVELAVRLEPKAEPHPLDRLGLARESLEILGTQIPLIRIPLHPGRNIAVLIEIAALNERLKSRGYDAARTFSAAVSERIRANGRKCR